MRKIVSAVTLSLALAVAGCATSPYGNFIEKKATLDQQAIAGDTVQQLATLYPPAKTRLELQQPAADPFGTAFVQDLRDRGYALLEFDPAPSKEGDDTSADGAQVQPQQIGLPLRYVIDQPAGTDLYRVTVQIGDQSITRPYMQQDGMVVPAGYWVRKE